jgi:hypothetical protein
MTGVEKIEAARMEWLTTTFGRDYERMPEQQKRQLEMAWYAAVSRVFKLTNEVSASDLHDALSAHMERVAKWTNASGRFL